MEEQLITTEKTAAITEMKQERPVENETLYWWRRPICTLPKNEKRSIRRKAERLTGRNGELYYKKRGGREVADRCTVCNLCTDMNLICRSVICKNEEDHGSMPYSPNFWAHGKHCQGSQSGFCGQESQRMSNIWCFHVML